MTQKKMQSGTSILLIFGIVTTTITPIFTHKVNAEIVITQNATFKDVTENHWAKQFIETLASRGIIAGVTGENYRPDDPVTRAEFAAMIRKAFPQEKNRNPIQFKDIPAKYWAADAIQETYQTGFLNGYSDNTFKPEEKITREQVLVSLASGLKYKPNNSVETVLQFYNDQKQISDYARNNIAATTERQIVVNYPQVNALNPKRNATRAEVAAFIYQALVSNAEIAAINSPYIVNVPTVKPPDTTLAIPLGTSIPIRYDKQKILLLPDEKVPVTFVISANLTTVDQEVLIPAGTQVIGELQPAEGGTQFIAKELILPNGQKLQINASSQVITKTEQINKGVKVTNILRDAGIGAAAAAAVS
ncbi:MAG TPA: S-layer homology domain-containing protein, partial [Allocoleopsis sp.]